MTKQISAFLLLISTVVSSWIYWTNETKLDNVLMSREWQSKMVTLIESTQPNDAVGPLHRVDVSSNVKYLPNGTYLRVSRVKLYSIEPLSADRPDNIINISESGEWSISDNYLLVSPTEFKDISSSYSKDFTPKQLQLITQLFKMDAQQSRRIDIINKKTLLLTSLSHGSTVLFGNG
ncbi:regulatory protein ToxS [Vibrio metschnikovii]|uniref:Regulatory protein ToxS n=1 Tax=Vibrio metschnikovii TaxID=28172 RepID=A0A9X0UHB1_VIBME|nr:regulatory protein ToxS [Vibrio metschnikovii]MBC5849799.1 regulatory protein ToxS [Vibrio metschnikovii]